MSKQAEKANKTTGYNVKLIRKRIGDARGKRLTQQEFADMLSKDGEHQYDAQYISMFERGERALPRKVAEKIIKIAPPGTRIEWLMGKDNFETEKDLFDFECHAARRDSEKSGIMEEEVLKKIANLAGYKLERVQMSFEEFLNGTEGYIFIDEHGKETRLSFFGSGGIQELWYDFFDYAAFRLKRTIEKKSISWSLSSEGGENNG